MKLGFLPYWPAQVWTCCPSEPTPLTAFVVSAWSGSGAGKPTTILSRKWLMRYICVLVSPFVRFTSQLNVVSVTSYAVSHILVNSVMTLSSPLLQDCEM